jgi:hydroxymethylbilane synthase
MRKIRIVSRQSKLAIIQSQMVAKSIKEKLALECEIIPISTKGDEILNQSLVKIGGKGLFVSSLQEYLFKQQADIAVHSAKDLPHTQERGLCFAAVLARGSPEDVLIANHAANIQQLPVNAIVGTSSLRRAAQILHQRPDLIVKSLRGNVPTRVYKLLNQEFDAIILAKAGLERLAMQDKIIQVLAVEQFLPAAGQGIIAVECLSDNYEVRNLLQAINCPITDQCLTVERDMCRALQATCQSPVAAIASHHNDFITLQGLVASPDGSIIKKVSATVPNQQFTNLGQMVALDLIQQGALEIIRLSQEQILMAECNI